MDRVTRSSGEQEAKITAAAKLTKKTTEECVLDIFKTAPLKECAISSTYG